MWSPTISSDELYHHGILGMKWGVRRYQNPDGTLTAAGRKHAGYFSKEQRAERKEDKKAAKTYDYKKSEQYKTGNRSSKTAMTNTYKVNKKVFGEKTANKIEYKVNAKGKDRKKETRKAFAKQVAIGIGIAAAVNLGPSAISAGKAYMQYGRSLAALNTSVADLYGATKGLNTVKGGFTLGIKQVNQGKKIASALAKHKFG